MEAEQPPMTSLEGWRLHAVKLRRQSAVTRGQAELLRRQHRDYAAKEADKLAAEGEAMACRIDQLTEDDMPWVRANYVRFQATGEDPEEDEDWQGFLVTLERRARAASGTNGAPFDTTGAPPAPP